MHNLWSFYKRRVNTLKDSSHSRSNALNRLKMLRDEMGLKTGCTSDFSLSRSPSFAQSPDAVSRTPVDTLADTVVDDTGANSKDTPDAQPLESTACREMKKCNQSSQTLNFLFYMSRLRISFLFLISDFLFSESALCILNIRHVTFSGSSFLNKYSFSIEKHRPLLFRPSFLKSIFS